MAKNKKLSAKEAMGALLAGKKIRNVFWSDSVYIELVGDAILDNRGEASYIGSEDDDVYELYEPSKRKVKKVMYQYVLQDLGSKRIFLTQTLYDKYDNMHGLQYKLIKVIEHEVEIEAKD